MEVQAVSREGLLDAAVRLACWESSSGDEPNSAVILLHGSPGQNRDLIPLAEQVPESDRLIIPDLPGFGHSEHNIPDYSVRAHAHYVRQLLDQLGVDRAHVVGFSPGAARRLSLGGLGVPKAMGVAALVLFLSLAISTFLSEDLTCIAAGVMVAQGRISFLLAVAACLAGIYAGDLLLFLLGRIFGQRALKRVPLKWFLKDRDVAASSAWFANRGFQVIVASRFLPGTRLPTYFAAGLLHTSFTRFAAYFLLAAVLWTPALVGLSAAVGAGVIDSDLFQGRGLPLKLAVAGMLAFLVMRLLLALGNHKGRRLLVSSWRRLTRWEFWPPWVFYPPVLCYVILLAVKHRSLTLFTVANPVMPAGGFIGESKSQILRGLSRAGDYVARFSVLDPSAGFTGCFRQAKAFMGENRLSFPVVLKPDVGQRGSGVAIVRSDAELEEYLRNSETAATRTQSGLGPYQESSALSRLWGEGGQRQGGGPAADEASTLGCKRSVPMTIIQEYVAGREFGVFYVRYPNARRGHIFSITEKRFPHVTGNGNKTLETLILDDPRAVCMASFYLKQLEPRLWEVPALGESVQLVELGTHCRGALFLDGNGMKTEALEAAIDRISQACDGFYFGRYDIRAPCLKDFKEGRNFKVVELNGVTSEATHIYDPKHSLWEAYRVLFEQWRIAFEIGAQNSQRNARQTSLPSLANLVFDFKRRPEISL